MMKRSYDRLFINNRRWAAERLQQDPNYFANMAKGQEPKYLLIGCSDSRVPPNEITQTAPGEMFIHRNVANLVVQTDMNLMSVLQYAVDVLQVEHVIVMGHYGCGGVVAAMQNAWHGLIDSWLCNIKDVYRTHREELTALPAGEARFRRLVELNVREQVTNLHKSPTIQRAQQQRGGQPQVHGWVYDLQTGLINDLESQRPADWETISDIYRIDPPFLDG